MHIRASVWNGQEGNRSGLLSAEWHEESKWDGLMVEGYNLLRVENMVPFEELMEKVGKKLKTGMLPETVTEWYVLVEPLLQDVPSVM